MSDEATYSVDILPPFTGENVQHWLKLCDFTFKTYKITDKDRIVYLLYRALPSEMQLDMASILESEDANKHKIFKDMIIKGTEIPVQRRLESLLSEAELGDRKPSAFLRHLRQLSGSSDCDAKLLRTIFLNRLPGTISQILAPMSNESLDAIAKAADQIYEYIPKSRSVNVCEPSMSSQQTLDLSKLSSTVSSVEQSSRALLNSTSSMADAISSLQSQLNALQNNFSSSLASINSQISSLQSAVNRVSSRSKSRVTYRSNNPVNLNQYCFYHSKFGTNATKCSQPCSWQSGN